MAHEEKHEGGEDVKGGKDAMGGIHIGRKDLWLVAGGALGALALLGLGKASKKVRPAAVGAVREGYAFKEWLAGKAEKLKEDVEDIVAEGVHQYHQDWPPLPIRSEKRRTSWRRSKRWSRRSWPG